jgi:type IV pilus assembly protein PilE
MRSTSASKLATGFTLIEVMIVVVIVAILASIALPSYQNYIVRTKLIEGQTSLGETRIKMEQYYQDNRNYGSSGTTCGLTMPTNKYFSITCATTSSGQGFTLTAANVVNQGLGAAGDYTYTVNHQNTKGTTEFKNVVYTAGTKPCWLYRGDEC